MGLLNKGHSYLSAEGVWFKFSLIFALLPSLFECIPSDGGGKV